MKLSNRKSLTAAALVVVLALAACGSSGSDEASDTTKAPSEETTAPETTVTDEGETEDESVPSDDSDAQARAESINVTVEDLPEGWTAVPHEESADDVWETCAGVVLDDISDAEYFTDDFQQGDVGSSSGLQISVGTRVLTDEADAESVIETTSSPEFVSCVNDSFQSSLGEVEVEGALEPVTFDVEGVDDYAAYGGSLSITDPAATETLEVSVAFLALRTGDLITGVSALAVGQEPDEAALTAVLDRVVQLQGQL